MFLGSGNGAFTGPTSFGAGNFQSDITIADVNGDHQLDALVANANDVTVSVLLGKGDGTFQSQIVVPGTTGNGYDLGDAVADLDGDGIPDLLVADYQPSDRRVRVLFGVGDGTFTGEQDLALSQNVVSTWVASADLNNDGLPDIITAGGSPSLSVIVNLGNQQFCPVDTISLGAVSATKVELGDFDDDGLLDVVTVGTDGSPAMVLINQND